LNCNQTSGAGTNLGQGGQDQERQSLEREISFFADIGLFFVPQKKRSLKKKSSPDLECLFDPNSSVP